jgi:hypothetical protein
VQFFYENPDDRRLEVIASRFGGTYEFIAEPIFDTGSGLDLIGVPR